MTTCFLCGCEAVGTCDWCGEAYCEYHMHWREDFEIERAGHTISVHRHQNPQFEAIAAQFGPFNPPDAI